MISAPDPNVLLDILIPNPGWFDRSLAAIEAAGKMGSLVICDIVYAELCAQFASQHELDSFLEENSIRMDMLSPNALA